MERRNWLESRFRDEEVDKRWTEMGGPKEVCRFGIGQILKAF